LNVVKNPLHIHTALRKEQEATSSGWIGTARLGHLFSNYSWSYSAVWQKPREGSYIWRVPSSSAVKSFTVMELDRYNRGLKIYCLKK